MNIVSPKIGLVIAIGPELTVYPLKFGPALVTSHVYVIEAVGCVGEVTKTS